ncbi:hypothetical protein HMI56_001473, partial [Coelomomyces lativittatus]
SFRDRVESNSSYTGGASTSSTATKKETISKAEWDAKLAAVQVSKTQLNKLILNYLVIEGYKDAAEQFCQEAELSIPVDLVSIDDRMQIRNAVQSGNIDEAIAKVNDLDPEILDTNPQLFFHLQQQKLIELIRKGDINSALDFAQKELAPRGEENPEYLAELEHTLALLVFQNASPASHLLDLEQRQKTAGELNAAILLSQSQEKDPKLPMLLKNLIWAQNKLAEKVNFPKMQNIATGEFDYDENDCHVSTAM